MRKFHHIPNERLLRLWLRASDSADDKSVPDGVRRDFRDISNIIIECLCRRGGPAAMEAIDALIKEAKHD